MNRITSRTATALIALALLTFAAAPGVSLALDNEPSDRTAVLVEAPSPPAASYMAREEALVLESSEGYNSGYIFGMTKGIANSTVHPAVKPVIFLVTIPLDLVLLPFAAIGGLF